MYQCGPYGLIMQPLEHLHLETELLEDTKYNDDAACS